MITLPLIEDPWYSFKTSLDGTVYTFTVQWNGRGEFWTMDIGDADGALIVSGIKFVVNTDLLVPYRGRQVPPGQLYILDETDDSRIAFEDFASNPRQLKLLYTGGA